ncbi:MAG: helix-turn-helix transcriptional regulator [Butyrivibrio sp.]|nr:helix-turn-helix transcriptional regulator [Butyrivibrio sp.]
MDNEKSLASGGMTMLILKLLSEKDMHGYEMIDTLRKRSQNVFEHKAGTLYPLLHSIEDENLVKGYEQETQSKIRKYYKLTRQGKKKLYKKPDRFNKLQKTMCEFIMWGL